MFLPRSCSPATAHPRSPPDRLLAQFPVDVIILCTFDTPVRFGMVIFIFPTLMPSLSSKSLQSLIRFKSWYSFQRFGFNPFRFQAWINPAVVVEYLNFHVDAFANHA